MSRIASGLGRWRSGQLAFFFGLWLCALPGGCDSGSTCSPDEPCECRDGDDCYLDCEGSGCRESCSSLKHCGGVCDDDCSFECHDMEDCSASCGTNCDINCHQAGSCGAFCGNFCSYTCAGVERCGVVVGPTSSVVCASVSSCEVVCQGDCHVVCSSVSRCSVSCASGATPITCPDGSLVCGTC